MPRDNNIPPYQEGFQTPDINLSHHVRRDKDTDVIPEITLYDIDYAIIYHLSENLKLSVNEGGKLVPVPIMYADSEKWVQIRKRGYIRDSENRLIAPLLVIRRTSIDEDSRITLLNMNNYRATFKYYPYITMNMQYDTLNRQSDRKLSYEYYIIDAPQYVRVSYELVIWTYMIEEMNKILQVIKSVSNHLWGDYHTFRTVVTSITNNTVNNVGDDRVVTSNVSLEVDGQLREEFIYHEPTMRKAYSIKKIRFDGETEVNDIYIDEPSPFMSKNHISNEPKHLQMMRKRRNIRYR